MAIEYLDPPSGRKFQYLDQDEKTLSRFGKNLVEDVKGTASGMMDLATRATDHPIDTAVEVAKGLPKAVIEEGKRLGVGKLFTEGPSAALSQFGEAAYEKPLSTAMSVVPAAGVVGKAMGFGGKAAKGAEIASQAAKLTPEMAAAAAEEAAGVIPLKRVIGNTVAKEAGGPPKPNFEVISPKQTPELPDILQKTKDYLGEKYAAAKLPSDPLKEVNDYVAAKYAKAASREGWPTRVAKYLQEESRNLGAKDLGLQPRQIQSMGPGFEGLQKAEALVDYARDKGYFNPKLTDIARKERIAETLEKSGQQLGAIREIASQRGAPPVADMMKAVKEQLTKGYGIDAPGEIKKVLAKINKMAKENPTFTGMADLATDLNKSKTAAQKMGQHPGPTTDAANIISRINNDSIRKFLNPQEADLYTNSLRDFGAHKKLEQAVAAANRRGMSARSNQRGIFGRLWQEALDRGGYRMGGNIADRTARAILKDPNKVKTLPQFFEELGHQADDVLDETLDIRGMAHGGIIDDELDEFLASKYA